ncbi:hypothetical protein GON26_19840 [Flavobacterium sp. GA093]|uniref:Uncharacterized protein n=1 Tax=Flavobacterium hydrocarbonoxydans TaxID=2683249 RepID=A0A6I4NR76_9FLAO|nr:hypothetical protein [Flavobacterium hydrocarbonoxydans]MWB96621.1 hypothetical protein [Flavobacterium hydrocarbonoxydans]
MKNIIIILLIYFFYSSCEEDKPEFIKSKAIGGLFLLKNPPKEDSLVKNLVKKFLLNNSKKNLKRMPDIDFYRYTSDTKYFLNHKEDDPSGLSLGEEQLSFYEEEKIAVFSISKCENDNANLIGELRFYNEYGNFYRPDTIIFKCY